MEITDLSIRQILAFGQREQGAEVGREVGEATMSPGSQDKIVS